MPAPSVITFSTACLVAIQAALLSQIDAAGGAASLKFFSAQDDLLGAVPLTDPAGAVDANNGKLTLTPATGVNTWSASGTVAYASIVTGAGAAVVSLPVVAGVTQVANKCVISSLSAIAGAEIRVALLTFG